MMNKILKPVVLAAGLIVSLCLAEAIEAPLGLGFVGDAQAIIGVAPGGSVARRHAVVATEAVVTTTAVAATTANASAAAAANASAQAAAAKPPPPPPPAPGTPPAIGTIVTTLPPGCVQTDLNGVAYQRCGATYYKASMMGSNLVFVVAQP
jgi:hypothetical protein